MATVEKKPSVASRMDRLESIIERHFAAQGSSSAPTATAAPAAVASEPVVAQATTANEDAVKAFLAEFGVCGAAKAAKASTPTTGSKRDAVLAAIKAKQDAAPAPAAKRELTPAMVAGTLAYNRWAAEGFTALGLAVPVADAEGYLPSPIVAALVATIPASAPAEVAEYVKAGFWASKDREGKTAYRAARMLTDDSLAALKKDVKKATKAVKEAKAADKAKAEVALASAEAKLEAAGKDAHFSAETARKAAEEDFLGAASVRLLGIPYFK